MFFKKKLLALPLALPEHTHYYEEEVEITDGFYAGHTGKVATYRYRAHTNEYIYAVRIGSIVTPYLDSKQLEGVY